MKSQQWYLELTTVCHVTRGEKGIVFIEKLCVGVTEIRSNKGNILNLPTCRNAIFSPPAAEPPNLFAPLPEKLGISADFSTFILQNYH